MKRVLLNIVLAISISSLMLSSCGNKSNQSNEDGASSAIESSSSDDEGIIGKGARKLLEADIRKSNRQCPMNAGSGITITSIEMSGKYVVYNAQCDESIVSIDALGENRLNVKQSIIETLRAESGLAENAFINLLKKSNTGLIYKYEGSTSGKVCSIKINASEL